MSAPATNDFELDLHRLDTPYLHSRVQRPQWVRRLMASIDAEGQQVALTVVGGPQRFVLVDGYLRWQALQHLGRDTARVELWTQAVGVALMQVLARQQGRHFEPIEQAWLLAAALAEGLSQRALATALGRDVSWVSRRLALLAQLAAPVQEAVREGVLSCWSASRVLVPLARANSADAERLLAALRQEPLSSRELATWHTHYAQANAQARTRMAEKPRLFIQALHHPATPEDPPGQWLAQLQQVRGKIAHLEHDLAALLASDPSPPTRTALRAGVEKTRRALERLHQLLQEDAHVVRAATPDDPSTAGQGGEHPRHRSPVGPHPAHGASGAQDGSDTRAACTGERGAIARDCLDAARALLREPGQCGADAAAAR